MAIQISDQKYELDNEFSLTKLKGKNVLSKNGEVLGTVKDIILKNNHVLGIIVSKVMKKDTFIERKFFHSFQEDAVILSIDPVTRMVGLRVFDLNGRYLGKVTKIVRDNTKNHFSRFMVKKSIFRKEMQFNAADIKTISQHVILKVEIDDV